MKKNYMVLNFWDLLTYNGHKLDGCNGMACLCRFDDRTELIGLVYDKEKGEYVQDYDVMWKMIEGATLNLYDALGYDIQIKAKAESEDKE